MSFDGLTRRGDMRETFAIASVLVRFCLGVFTCAAAPDDVAASSQDEQTTVARPHGEAQLLFHALDPDKGKFGYIDQGGAVSIPFRFDVALPFRDDGFAVTYMDAPPEDQRLYRAAIINRKGEMVFSGGYRIEPMGRGRFAVQERDGVRFVSFFEPFAVALKCTEVRWEPSEGTFAVGVEGKWGFIDDKGDVAIRPKFDGVRPFTEGLAPAVSGEKWGYINHAGNWVIQPQFDRAYQFREGLAAVSNEGRGWYIDHTGKRAFEGDYAQVQEFSEGLGCVRDAKSNLWGYVDRSGGVVIPAVLRSARPFSEGLAVAADNQGEGGYIDHAGKFVITLPTKQGTHTDFRNGRAKVITADRTGYIDRRGAWIWASRASSR
jgi:hypothetical protein